MMWGENEKKILSCSNKEQSVQHLRTKDHKNFALVHAFFHSSVRGRKTEMLTGVGRKYPRGESDESTVVTAKILRSR